MSRSLSLSIPLHLFVPTPSAPSTAPILAPVGSIQEATKAHHANGDLLTAHHGTDPDVVFEYRVTAGSVSAGHIKVDISGATTAADVAAILLPLLNANLPRQTATDGGTGLINMAGILADDLPYTFTETVVDASYVATDMAVPTGTKTWTYKIVGIASDGTHSPASAGGSTAAGGSALSIANLNRITWTDPANAVSVQIWRTVDGAASTPSTLGLIGTVAAGVQTFDDTGLAGDAATAPTTNTTGVGTAVGVGDMADLTVEVEGTFVATLQVQGEIDGGSGTFVDIGSSLNAPGLVDVSATAKALSQIRVKVTAYTSGTPTAAVAGH